MAKLLLIEDDPQVQSYLRRVLTKSQHEVCVASDGAEGTELAKDPGIELMLVDLQLPGDLTGLDLVRSLRQQRPDCPVIVVSGFPTRERLEELQRMGVSDFLTKPFEMGFVTETISRLLKAV